jgi:hypothetical protein
MNFSSFVGCSKICAKHRAALMRARLHRAPLQHNASSYFLSCLLIYVAKCCLEIALSDFVVVCEFPGAAIVKCHMLFFRAIAPTNACVNRYAPCASAVLLHALFWFSKLLGKKRSLLLVTTAVPTIVPSSDHPS